jgi:hypothetical protein
MNTSRSVILPPIRDDRMHGLHTETSPTGIRSEYSVTGTNVTEALRKKLRNSNSDRVDRGRWRGRHGTPASPFRWVYISTRLQHFIRVCLLAGRSMSWFWK